MLNQYPRKSGSDVVVNEEDWNQDNQFGHCPACGSIGIEELRISGDPDIFFYCSDVTCKTVMGNRGPARTRWYRSKPEEALKKERDGWSWNEEHFPGQDMPDVCPD